jgi:allantoicase
VSLSTAADASVDESTVWTPILERTAVQPDTRHRYLVSSAGPDPATHVRLDVYPDGGLSRLRVHGTLPSASLEAARRRWWDHLPEHHRAVLA